MTGWLFGWRSVPGIDLTVRSLEAIFWIMTEEEALIQAALDEPCDQSAMMVYADWLEERGDPRGRLLRLQMEPVPAKKDREAVSSRRTEFQSLLRSIDSKWLQRFGLILRDESLFDATQVVHGWLRDGRYGSRQKAVRALRHRKAYLGFSKEEVAEDFDLAETIQNEVGRFKVELRERGESQSILDQVSNLQANLQRRFPNVDDAALSCAIGINLATWHRL